MHGGGPRSQPGCSVEQQRREHAALRAACRAAQVAVRAAEDESRDILQARQRQEQSTVLVTPHYDTGRAKVQPDNTRQPPAPAAQGAAC